MPFHASISKETGDWVADASVSDVEMDSIRSIYGCADVRMQVAVDEVMCAPC